ncbi:MAG: YicC family protein [Rhodospirillaceae bacterium]|nr:YicC family protein [Rhodospirillaceae bacterium]MBT4588961.1 YicC family protein [Rhodospirillaceae bacterium]MBT4939457.1 YicC family protein [Rhodospirillaceae bacterium]MBT7267241.1 YicC family protein [Rhodospirillaceae bacterium]
MTGFARSSGSVDGYSWNWEAKSVNGKGLDVRCRLPQGFEEVDVEARTATGKAFKRGNFNLILTIQETSQQSQYQINRALLDQLVETAKELQVDLDGFDKPSLDGLFAVRGVIEQVTESDDEAELTARKKEVLGGLKEVLSSLAQNRLDEGLRIGEVLFDQLDAIIKLCQQAEKIAALQPENIREKLNQQIAELLEAVPSLPEERLAQEAAVLMTKADVREELDRLQAHIEAAKDLMDGGGVIGRRLDFLCQEFNREANTLCSKAADVELSKIGLELKAVIEQYREQVQNIE